MRANMMPVFRRSLLILCVLCGIIFPAWAQEDPSPSLFKEEPRNGYEMDGIRMSDYPDFHKKWKVVTFSYRSDLHELRIVYANPLAYETLMKGSTDYPDGAVFAKIPMNMADDSAFPNSEVARSAERYQFMVRNKKKYSDSYGWGYAVFDLWGRVFQSVEKRTETTSGDKSHCVACHTNVKDRNYIFSRPPQLDRTRIQAWIKNQEMDATDPSFSDYPRDKLPADIQKLVPAEYATVRLFGNSVQNTEFNGTMFETRPVLIKEAMRSGQPALLLSKSGKRLCLVEPVDPAKEPTALACNEHARLYASYWTLGINPDDWVSKDLFCRSKQP
jgi:Cytochrome P460